MILIQKQQKLSLSSGKYGKYEHLTGKKIFISVKSQITDQAKFTYCSLGKTSEKQIKVIEDQGNTI